MYLVAGLGNPGEEYAHTPHNMGFLLVDRLAIENRIPVTRPDSKALIGLGSLGGADLMLAKPQTFMNSSGTSLRPLMKKHDIPASRLILAYDELDLPWGDLRIRPNGRPHGHNGVASVVENLGTEEFARVRLGVHPGHPLTGVDYLLSRFSRRQTNELDGVLRFAAEAVASIIAEGVEKSMAKYNRRAGGSHTEEQ